MKSMKSAPEKEEKMSGLTNYWVKVFEPLTEQTYQ